MSLQLEAIIPWGRTRHEYELMFNLDAADLGKKILGCGDGPASFNAEMTHAGMAVTSCDPIYSFSGADIAAQFHANAATITDQVRASLDTWNWDYHDSPEGLLANRQMALRSFLADYDAGKAAGRYTVAALPQLPFADAEFELALCSHLLFLYSNQLSEEFHHRSLHELCRVAGEVRVFPLLTLAHQRSPHLQPVLQRLGEAGLDAQVVRVGYEFQKGGNEMLRIRRR